MSYFVGFLWSKLLSLTTSNLECNSSPLTDAKAVNRNLNEFTELFSDSIKEVSGNNEDKINKRKDEYKTVVSHYYDMATDFYEYGWGQSFHFAPRYQGESFRMSVARHEHWLAAQMGLKAGDKVLDLGCGVGGPYRSIARFSGATITGITINQYQVKRGNAENEKQGVDHMCKSVLGDFMHLPFPSESFDHAYAIESTCHAPNRSKCFNQVFEVLKPGGVFAGFEWVMTEKYDPCDMNQRRIKFDIEKGDGLPELTSVQNVLDSLKSSGFEVLDFMDLAESAKKLGQTFPWYQTLGNHLSLETIAQSSYGRFVTHYLVNLLEKLRVAPKGTKETHAILATAANALVEAGKMEIFTPMFFFLARKPLISRK